MAKDIGLITMHGMGMVKPFYHEELIKRLRDKLGENEWDNRVAVNAVQYQPSFQENQDEAIEALEEEHDLDGLFLRKFLLHSFGDAAALERSFRHDKETYLEVQAQIAQAFDRCFQDFGRERKPVVIVSQSLGCQVLANYFWDAQEGKGLFVENGAGNEGDDEEVAFRKGSHVSYFFTTGCNIALFIAGLNREERNCFDRPNDQFRWHNYFDKDDVLGWPLKPLSSSFHQCVDEDHEVNVGGMLTNWNPLCHGEYWSDKNVLKPIKNRMLALLS